MSGDDEQKPFGARNWNLGPETAPQVRLAYHGQGTEHQMVYTSNPVSWLVGLTQCIPFLNIKSGNVQSPVDAAAIDQLDSQSYDPGVLSGGGSVFFNGSLQLPSSAMPGGVTSPRQDISAVLPITGFADNGIPLGTVVAPTPVSGQSVGSRTVPLWGSRKTTGTSI